MANTTRTKNQTLTTEWSRMDLSHLDLAIEDVKSVTVKPATKDTVEMRGKVGDDAINIGAGIIIDVDFDDRYVDYLPQFRATSGSKVCGFVASVEREI